MNQYKARFAVETGMRTLTDAMRGADVFFGVSAGNCVTPAMLLVMADKPIVFALANPDPEITYPLAVKTRSDVIMATGRSDFPNQVNNVLGFPAMFRGALDVRATTINEEMKLAATRALAELAKQDVPDSVCRIYGVKRLEFGRDYIIPKAFDPRVLISVASAMAEAAVSSGVARIPVDIDEYRNQLEKRFGTTHGVMGVMIRKARSKPMRVVFPEGEESAKQEPRPAIIFASQQRCQDGDCIGTAHEDYQKLARLYGRLVGHDAVSGYAYPVQTGADGTQTADYHRVLQGGDDPDRQWTANQHRAYRRRPKECSAKQ
jgi:malate dehydrogenase (oxaloacetate-decarboxylating)(NADP+)